MDIERVALPCAEKKKRTKKKNTKQNTTACFLLWFKQFIFIFYSEADMFCLYKMLRHNKLANKLRPHMGIDRQRVLCADGQPVLYSNDYNIFNFV